MREPKPSSGYLAVILLIIVGVCGQSLIFTALPPVLPLIAAHFSGGKDGVFVAQMMMAMPSAGFFMGGLFAGEIVDRVSLRPTFLVSLFSFAIAGAIPLFAMSAEVLLASRFAIGLANACLSVACTAYLVRHFDGAGRERALAWQGVGAAVVAFASLFIGGALGDLGGWRMPFLLYPLLVMPAIMAALLIEPGGRQPATPADYHIRDRDERAGPSKHLLWGLLFLVPFNIIVVTGSVQLPFLLDRKGISDPLEQALVLGGGQMAQVLGAILFVPVLARFGIANALRFCVLCLSAGLFGSVAAQGIFQSLLAKAIFTLANGMLLPLYSHIVISLSTDRQRNRAIGWMSSAIFIGILLNPPVIAALGETLSLEKTYFLLGGVLIAVCMLSLVPVRGLVTRLDRRERERRT